MFVLGIAALLVASGFVVNGVRAQSNVTPHGGPSAPPQAEGKKAEEQVKNIQVLKGVPAEQIFPTMQFITASLGVECDFCHLQGAFEKDDKKNKQTARKMMEMMFAINADDFNGYRTVTCNTCHRGSAEPQAIPAVMSEEPKETMGAPKKAEGEAKENDARANALPPAEQLLDKYVQAAGGAAAIEKSRAA
jgi:photosynthetic reaction center cytochrome c subunit